MSIDIAILGLIISVMVYVFLSEKLPMDLTALIGLLLVTFLGYVTPKEAFSGFSSPPVVTMLSMFFLGAALRETGIADWIAARIFNFAGVRESLNVALVMGLGAFFSSFMNNVAAAALLLPAVMSIAEKSGVSPSRLLMPLSFATILGGMTTLIGTAPNIIASEVLSSKGLEPFHFADFTPIGLTCVIVGILYMVFVGRHMLPRHAIPAQTRRDLVKLYQLFERIFCIRISNSSHFDGQTLADTKIGTVLGAHVIAVVRAGKVELAPRAEFILRQNDILVMGGRVGDLEALRRFSEIEMVEDSVDSLLPESVSVRGSILLYTAKESTTLRAMNFHHLVGGMVVGIKRQDSLHYKNLGDFPLRVGDCLYLLRNSDNELDISSVNEVEILEADTPARDLLSQNVFAMRVHTGSSLDGLTVEESRFGELAGLTLAGILRKGTFQFCGDGSQILQEEDVLFLVGEPRQIEQVARFGRLDIVPDFELPALESGNVGFVEVILSPRSKLLGSSIRELSFRERYDLQVAAVWRAGRPIRSRISNLVLELGDALLLHGARGKIALLTENRDFVVLSEPLKLPRRASRAPWVILALLALIVLPAFELQPVQVAAVLAAVVVVLSGAVRMDEGYREVGWRIIFFVGALLPLGIALDRTGGAQLLAHGMVKFADSYGFELAIVSLAIISSLVSQMLDSSIAVVLLSPIAVESATHLNANVFGVVMAVTLAASIAFMTPFSHKANLLIMGAGGYRSRDFLRVGGLMTLIILAVVLGLIPVLFP